MPKIFITGGISSGKSDFAEKLALSEYKAIIAEGKKAGGSDKAAMDGRKLLHFIATAESGGNRTEDAEMSLKILKHRNKRDKSFAVHENLVDLNGEIDGICASIKGGEGVILIDSVTMWLSSVFRSGDDYEAAADAVGRLSGKIKTIECSVITVADSLGFNMVPADAYLRKFIELNGLMEQGLSSLSDKAYCVIAGNPVILK